MRHIALRVTALAALLASAAPSRAGLLDEPPKMLSFKLDDPAHPKLTMLRAFHDAEVEKPGPLKSYLASPWGKWAPEPWWRLSWGVGATSALEGDDAKPAFDDDAPGEELIDLDDMERQSEALRIERQAPSWLRAIDPSFSSLDVAWTGPSLASDGFGALWDSSKPVPNWRCRRRPVRFMRYAGESDAFELVRCDGSVAPQALDRLTLIARPTDVARPGDLLPDEPDGLAWATEREWLPGIRLVNPRLLWVLQRISDAFPWRPIYVFSGYRPHNKGSASNNHHSMHAKARAMDIGVMGIRNEDLFRFCRTLEDVGCGYYPNSKFVHVDVRPPGTGHAFWIDDSGPGEASHYVDGWPGVIEHGAMVWKKATDDSPYDP